MKLNTFFVALALSSCAITLAAPLPQGGSGFGAAKKLLGKVKSFGRKGGESSVSHGTEDIYHQDFVHEHAPEHIPEHVVAPSYHPTPQTSHQATPEHSRPPTPQTFSREDSPEPLSPPRIRQSVPGRAMAPWQPPPSPEAPYYPMRYEPDPHSVVASPPQGHYNPGYYAPQSQYGHEPVQPPVYGYQQSRHYYPDAPPGTQHGTYEHNPYPDYHNNDHYRGW